MPIVLAFGRSLDRQLKQEGTHKNVERNSDVDEHSIHNIDSLFDLAFLRQNWYKGCIRLLVPGYEIKVKVGRERV